jgi:SUMO ligase MMS21 Smc5/6 complex component
MQRVIIPSKQSSETLLQAFDFTSLLGQLSTTTISSATSTIAVYSGTDPSPPSLTNSISGLVVTVTLSGGVSGVIYLVTVTATASTGAIVSLQGFLAVVPGLV